MASSYSNTIPSGSPAALALSKKINPIPLTTSVGNTNGKFQITAPQSMNNMGIKTTTPMVNLQTSPASGTGGGGSLGTSTPQKISAPQQIAPAPQYTTAVAPQTTSPSYQQNTGSNYSGGYTPPAATQTASANTNTSGMMNPLLQQAIDAQKRAVGINQALNQGISNISQKPIALEFQQGQQAALQRDYGVQAQAANQEAQNATQLVPYGQPSPSAYGQTTFNPLTGQFGSSGGSTGSTQVVNPNDQLYPAMQQYAQLRATGQESLIPGSITGNPALNAQVTSMAQQNNPGYNANTAAGQASAQQSNAQIGGTAAVNAGNSLYQSANPEYQTLKQTTLPNIENFGQLLTQGAGGVNPFDIKFLNGTLAEFKRQLSNSQQAQFDATFQQLQKNISTLAASGGVQTPTANVLQSGATLDPNMKMSTLQNTLQRIAQEGNIYLTNQGNLSNTALNQAQGGGSSTSSTSSSGNWPGWNP